MALYDIDPFNSDRDTPTPNGKDALLEGARMAHQTMSTTYSPTGAQPQQQRIAMKNNMIVFYDNNNNISSIYGIVSSSGTVPVLITAKPGKDVFTDVLGIARPVGL